MYFIQQDMITYNLNTCGSTKFYALFTWLCHSHQSSFGEHHGEAPDHPNGILPDTTKLNCVPWKRA